MRVPEENKKFDLSLRDLRADLLIATQGAALQTNNGRL